MSTTKITFTRKESLAQQRVNILNAKAQLPIIARDINQDIKCAILLINKLKNLDIEDLAFEFGKPWIEFKILMLKLFDLREKQMAKRNKYRFSSKGRLRQ